MKLGIPNRSNSLPPLPEITLTDNSNSSSSPSSSSAKQMEFHQKMILRRKQAEMYSLWCDTLYRLSLANYVSLNLEKKEGKKLEIYLIF